MNVLHKATYLECFMKVKCGGPQYKLVPEQLLSQGLFGSYKVMFYTIK